MSVHIDKFCAHEEQMCNIGSANWSIPRLINLSESLEVLDIPLKHINIANNYKNLYLRDMVMHFRAVQDANLKYPIILDEDGEIMDGRHRIMKALLENKETIKAVRFDKNPSPCRIDE